MVDANMNAGGLNAAQTPVTQSSSQEASPQERIGENQRTYDLVIWGATGYTGNLTLEYLSQRYNGITGRGIRFAIAGRNAGKLRSLAQRVSSKMQAELGDVLKFPEIPIIVADLEDFASLTAMCSATKSLISLGGPFALYGEEIIKACIEAGTHYVDATAECDWMMRMMKEYHSKAAEKNIKIIFSCGFDFVPNDMLIFSMRKVLAKLSNEGKCSAQPTKLFQIMKTSTKDLSGGTAKSGVLAFSRMSIVGCFQYLLDSYVMCKDRSIFNTPTTAIQKYTPRYEPRIGQWTSPFVMTPFIEKYIMWSNEIQGYPLGKNILYIGVENSKDLLSCLAVYFRFVIGFLVVVLISRFPHLSETFKPPGTGPNLDDRTNDFMETKLIATVTPSTQSGQPLSGMETSLLQKEKMSVEIKWRIEHAEAYILTGMFLAEAAILMATNIKDTPSNFGICSISSGLGDPYLEKIEQLPHFKSTVSELIVEHDENSPTKDD